MGAKLGIDAKLFRIAPAEEAEQGERIYRCPITGRLVCDKEIRFHKATLANAQSHAQADAVKELETEADSPAIVPSFETSYP